MLADPLRRNFVWLAIPLLGCGSDTTESPSDVADSASTTEVAADTTSTAAEVDVAVVSCAPPGHSGGELSLAVGVVDATITLADGSPVANLFVSVCGTNICDTGMTDGAGHVQVNVGKSLTRPVFRAGDGYTYGEIAVPLAAGDNTLGAVHTAALPASGAMLAAGAEASSATMTLTLAADAEVAIDTLVYDTAEKQQFRATLMAEADADFLVASFGRDAIVYLVGPLATTFCPPAAVRVDNSLHWPAGAGVDVWILGDDVGQDWAPFGEWQRIAGAVVSADGASIETRAGTGLPVLATLAFSLTP